MSCTVDITTKQAGQFVVALIGRLDSAAAPDCEQKITPLLTGTLKALILDLSQLSYISSMGLRLIFKIKSAVETNQGVFIMTNLQPQIAKVLEIAHALPRETIFQNIAEADRYLAGIQQREIERQQSDH